MTPPVLAGREREKAVIIEALDYLGEGCNPAANIALIGPCGNGKTSLLQWVKTLCRSLRRQNKMRNSEARLFQVTL